VAEDGGIDLRTHSGAWFEPHAESDRAIEIYPAQAGNVEAAAVAFAPQLDRGNDVCRPR
jgi:hypothetical protein